MLLFNYLFIQNHTDMCKSFLSDKNTYYISVCIITTFIIKNKNETVAAMKRWKYKYL